MSSLSSDRIDFRIKKTDEKKATQKGGKRRRNSIKRPKYRKPTKLPCQFEDCPNKAITEHRCSAKLKLCCFKDYGCGKLFCIEHESPRRTYTCFVQEEGKNETYVCY
mmetsp:Transcript_23361/g.28972  ORF Transcript_23361/g.28972 Transcript_23361/m.28972 type:complete len:107 (+) Transcript_23361:345-665(+)